MLVTNTLAFWSGEKKKVYNFDSNIQWYKTIIFIICYSTQKLDHVALVNLLGLLLYWLSRSVLWSPVSNIENTNSQCYKIFQVLPTWLGSSLTTKYQTRLERFDRDNHLVYLASFQ